MSRYSKRSKLINDSEQYQSDELLGSRGVKEKVQFDTPKFRRLTREQYNSIKYVRYFWKIGDRFWKLADKYYGDKTKWWVIASFNFVPTEAEVEEGQEIRIPRNLSAVIGLFK